MKLIPTSVNPVTITLYQGIPFDNNYSEHTLLSTKFLYRRFIGDNNRNVGNSKENFINMKNSQNQYYYPRTTKSGTYNFAFGNGLVTSLVIELTDNEINSNYMKVVSGSDTYYYFITGLTQKNEVTYLLNLELDVIMTFGDEFLDNVALKPIMVERKHARRIRQTRAIISPYTITTKVNDVCFNQESTFNKLKSNIVKEFTPLEFKDFINGSTDFNSVMGELNWIYIILGNENQTYFSTYLENDVEYPYCVVCLPSIPVNIPNVNGKTFIWSASLELNHFVGDPAVQKIIVSPFPPFKVCSNVTLTKTGTTYNLNVTSGQWLSPVFDFYSGSNSTGSELYAYVRDNSGQLVSQGFVILRKGFGGKFEYTTKQSYFDTTLPSTSNARDYGEFKLQIAPFKDLRMSSYYGGEYNIHTQYLLLKNVTSSSMDIHTYTIASTNPEVNSYFDYADVGNYPVDSKRGISNSVAYNFPSGTNAELLYNQTQKNQYENSKTIGAISNGMKILGGGLAVALAPNLMTKVAGGVSLASGVLGEVDTFTSWTAKMEDLSNTPNTYNFAGSSYAYDIAISKSGSKTNKNLLPYLITYGVTDREEDMAGEFIYNYGYEYNIECYFNTLLTNNSDDVFNRILFNYVKIRDDITSKIVGSNLPLIVAQKFNDILNAGIKLWTFFDMDLTNTTTATNVISNYFQKTTYCNAELSS